MNLGFKLKLNEDVVRFSPDGKVVLLDAIKALTGRDPSEELLVGMKTRVSGIAERCEERDIPGEGSLTVICSDGWLHVFDWLRQAPCLVDEETPEK
jgi:hypothetical protein